MEDRESAKSTALAMQGPTGTQGAQGPQGGMDVQGSPGTQGAALGVRGDTGIQGVSGAQRPAGAQGASDPQGGTDPQVVPGPQGHPGVQGPPDARGPAGPVGEVAICAAKYVYMPGSDVTVADTLLIPASEFIGDDEDRVSEFDLAGPNSYANLYMNGVVQRTSTYRLDADFLAIDSPGETICAGTPIVVEIVQVLVLPSS